MNFESACAGLHKYVLKYELLCILICNQSLTKLIVYHKFGNNINIKYFLPDNDKFYVFPNQNIYRIIFVMFQYQRNDILTYP